jgi:3-hydroxyanthranilate 3,4-dioxygenase
MKSLTAFSFRTWIDEHRHLLKPPVCNQQVFEENDFIVMVVGGPNSRTDYHYDEGPEFFYQVEGDMLLRTIQDGKRVDIPIREGEILLLPPKVPHSPQRFRDTVGLVIERKRGTRRLHVVLRPVRQQALRGVSLYQRHRRTASADFRSLLRLRGQPHLRQVRLGDAAQVSGSAC